jgi:hypothetical protein
MAISIKGADLSIIQKLKKLQTSTSEDKRLYSYLDKAFDKLKQDPYCGERVLKKRIPKSYLGKSGFDNLLILGLPGAWRLLYSVERFEDNIVVVVVDFMSHTEYDRLLGYSRK